MIPEEDQRRIDDFCAEQWPESFRDQVRWESHAQGDNVTICETRAPWDGEGKWTHEPRAQLRFRSGAHDWQLYWADSNDRWHVYDQGDRGPNGTCADLLAEIDDDPTSIFKG